MHTCAKVCHVNSMLGAWSVHVARGARCTHTTSTEPTTGAEPPSDRGGGATSRSRATGAAGPPVGREQPGRRGHQSAPQPGQTGHQSARATGAAGPPVAAPTGAAGPPVTTAERGPGAARDNSRLGPRGHQPAKSKGQGPAPRQIDRRRYAAARRGWRARARRQGNGGPAGTGPMTSRLRQESGAGEDLGRGSGRAIRR